MADMDKATRKPPATAWKPGQSGNPKGRPQGSRTKAALVAEAMLSGQLEGVLQTVVAAALAGDMSAAKIIVERILPPAKGRPVSIELPKVSSIEGAQEAQAAIIDAATSGELLTSEAMTLSALVENQRKAIETGVLEQRLKAVEARLVQ